MSLHHTFMLKIFRMEIDGVLENRAVYSLQNHVGPADE